MNHLKAWLAGSCNRLPAILGTLGILLAGSATADTFVLPPPGVDVIGEPKVIYALDEDTLMDIGRAYDLGYDEILQANPTVDRWIPGAGTPVVLPTRFILPDAPRQGIVLNLAEKRLYFFPKPKRGEKPLVITHPIGVGRMDWETPLGLTRITTKVKGPQWRPPASIKQEHLELYGEVLPDVVPAGPDNPLGQFALRLGLPGYLMHGTNKRDGVGSRVSHGCVRLYNEDIEQLFGQVSVGTEVRIVNQPIKAGWFANTLFLEAHPPFEEEKETLQELSLSDAMAIIRSRVGDAASAAEDLIDVDDRQLASILNDSSGLPVPILN